jgi:hypothetical protein
VAAKLRDWRLCGRLIESLEEIRDSDELGIIGMRQIMDWRGWKPKIVGELYSIGTKFTWAVCQAGTNCATFDGQGRIDYKAMGEALAILMTT